MRAGPVLENRAPTGLGRRLTEACLLRGLTQTQLAERAGTSQAIIQKIENGESLLPRMLPELAEARV